MHDTLPSRSVVLGLALVGLSIASLGSESRIALTGVNLAGGEFYEPKRGIKPAYGEKYSYPTEGEIAYFAAQGMNLFRYQFLWETLQPQPKTPLDPADLARLKASVGFATSRHLVVLLDPHNYARYYADNVVGGPKVGFDDFADFWGRLAAEFSDNPYVWFGLVNEPHDMPTRQWFKAANSAIAAIRSAGARNLILVPGNSWTGAHSWTSGVDVESNAKNVLTITDPLNYWIIEVHQYLDEDSSGTHKSVVSPTVGSERLRSFVTWCRQNGMRAVLGEFATPVSPNAREATEDMLRSVERDSDVWLGWTWWAAGARWGDYMFTLEPLEGKDRTQMSWLRPHLSGAAMPKFDLRIKNGKGGGSLEASSIRTIQASMAPEGMAFKVWEGDVAWLKDPASPTTTVVIPFKNIHLEAVFQARR